MNIYPDLSKSKYISLDVETKDPGIKADRLSAFKKEGYVLGFSVGTDDGFKAYYPLRHPGEGNLDEKKTILWLKKQAATDVPKVGANILYDLEWLKLGLGVDVNGKKVCVQAVEALLNENQKSYSLDNIAKRRLGLAKDEGALYAAADRLGVDHDKIKENLWQMTVAEVRAYGEGDADLPIGILKNQLEEIKKEGMERVCDLECATLDVLFAMRMRGLRVDVPYAEKLKIELDKREKDAREKLRKLAKREVDVWSGQDIALAAGALGLAFPVTAKSNPSFTGDWLEAQPQKFFRLVREARRVNRMSEVFVKSKVLELVYNGRVYPSYYSTRKDDYGTVTGRFSSANPNMQQIPIRDEELGPMVRKMFLPEEGEAWHTFDYNQQEPRLLVHFACACGLKSAYVAKKRYQDDPATDYHQMTADLAEITRKQAKPINLGISYGMGKAKLALKLGLPFNEAAAILERYHQAMPYVRQLADLCTRLAETRGYIKTIMGRRRHFELWGPTYYEKGMLPLPHEEAVAQYGPFVKRWFTYRAGNAVIQGSAADMIKAAMVAVFKETGKAPLVTVHDENDYSIGGKDGKTVKTIEKCMLGAVDLEVPLKVDHEAGPSWGEAR